MNVDKFQFTSLWADWLLIYSIPMANNDEQFEDDNKNNIFQHLEFNKESILDLAEGNYEID